VQKFTAEKKELYDAKTRMLGVEQVRILLREDPEFDYDIFMGTAEFIGYEPSGRMIVADGEKTDLDLLLEDYANQADLPPDDIDLLEFASQHHGEKSHRRRDQIVRGTQKGLKTSFVVPLSMTEDRLDPPYYLLRRQGGDLIDSLPKLGARVHNAGAKFLPKTDDELDAEYKLLSVSSDGRVSLNEMRKGEEFTRAYKRVRQNDIVYNPMRINIGSIGVVPEDLDGGLVSPDYVVFHTAGIDSDFLVDLLRCPFYRMYIDVVTTGSIRDRLYFPELKKLRVPDVGKASQAQFSEYGSRIEAEAERLLHQIAAERGEANDQLHYLVRSAAETSTDIENAFLALAERWHSETGLHSSIPKKLKHPAYRKIITLGRAAVPHILRELETRPAYWFAALSEITGAEPVPESARRSVKKTAAAWLEWGRGQGYLSNDDSED
jgi:type I restriction enzyme M protein